MTSVNSRPDVQHVSEALRRAAAGGRVGLRVAEELQGFVFGPGHVDAPVIRALVQPVGLVVVVGADAGQTQHGVPVFDQLRLQTPPSQTQTPRPIRTDIQIRFEVGSDSKPMRFN